MQTTKQHEEETSPFLFKSQPADAKDFARPVAGVTLESGVHVSIRKVGYCWRSMEVVTSVQFVEDGKVIASDANTARNLAAQLPADTAKYLLRVIDSIYEVK